MLSQKKILFIGTDTRILSSFDDSTESEVISSVQFLDTVLFAFMPNLIICNSVYDIDPLVIRRNPKLTFVPVLVLAERIQDLTNFEKLLQAPHVLLCNQSVFPNRKFIARLESVIKDPSQMLGTKTAAVVKRALLIINRMMGQHLTRDAIAGQTGTNRDYLSRVFRREMGMELWTYVNSCRLSEGRNLLLTTGLSIKEIALSLGFTDDAYFNRLFAKEFSLTPGQFRSGNGTAFPPAMPSA